ncbi:piggyBac transposable element-derived protein 4-like [Nasonia vitripennis]|uniref:PiggyBac transposable element-derived protein domain-containing protein n=1 Tax=Nasonia vitripennis TaxID=7425 RepID=A0A7M7H931_NASVI|nr:piggyBac transposable element-derived protein 4-like [Nasonia vitripennis]
MWILMGIHKLPRVRNYWSSDPFLKVDCVANIMPYTRFSKLTEMIHFNDNDSMLPRTDPNYDKLHKIRPLIDHINQTSNKSYNTSKTVSVDESMIPFSGRSSFIQYMPMKPIKRGFKVWCLADSSTGYVVKSEVYTGKARDGSKNPLGERVVLNLVSNILGVGYLVAFDNFFTSINLVEELLDKGIYSVGTVRNNRKGLPEMMKAKEKMKRGDFNYRIKKGISAIKWMDRKPVTVLTSAFNPTETVEITRKLKDRSRLPIFCPITIQAYNKIMGGVDRFDQLREVYMIGRRSKNWWHSIMYYYIDMAIVNCYILYKCYKEGECEDQLAFRIQLAKQLIGDYNGRKRFRDSK